MVFINYLSCCDYETKEGLRVKWWRLPDLNRSPLQCHCSALPDELNPRFHLPDSLNQDRNRLRRVSTQSTELCFYRESKCNIDAPLTELYPRSLCRRSPPHRCEVRLVYASSSFPCQRFFSLLASKRLLFYDDPS